MRNTERGKNIGRERSRLPTGFFPREAYREPDVELDSRTPESWPEPKADAQQMSHPGASKNDSSSHVFIA